jgi:hypothetical protein
MRDPQFDWYLAALAGERGDFDIHNPPSGYYRDRDRSIALWRDGDKPVWIVSSGFKPRAFDQLCEMMGTFIVTPVPYEAWEHHRDTGIWPEDPTAEIAAARTPGIGHNSGRPEAEILDELQAIRSAFDGWLAGIGGAVTNESHDAKVKEFTNRVANLKKKAIAGHKAEKQPFLDAGREVDRRWDAAKDRTDAEQRAMAKTAEAYRLEREYIQAEEARLAREAAAEARRQAQAAGQPAPVFQAPRKAATGLRTVTRVILDDFPAAAAFLAAQPVVDPDLTKACQKMARVLLERGEAVPGARLEQSKVAA